MARTELDQLGAVRPEIGCPDWSVITLDERAALLDAITAAGRQRDKCTAGVHGSRRARPVAPGPGPILASIALVSVMIYVGLLALVHPAMTDLLIYRQEGAAVRSGASLYGTLYRSSLPVATAHATYPPFTAIMFVPLSYVPLAAVRAATAAGNLALLAITVILAARLVDTPRRERANTICALFAVAPWCEPVLTAIRLGQIDLLILALVLWDFTRAPHSRLRGLGVGLAAGLKVTPVIFIVYLLLTRRVRAAGTAVATLLTTVVLSGLVLPTATWEYWTHDLYDTRRVGRVENAVNQSLRGLIARVGHTRSVTATELLLVGSVAIAGLGCAVIAQRHLGEGWGLCTCAVTGLLVAPISWTHYWIWCLPIGLLMWRDVGRARWLVVVFWTYLVWAGPHRDGEELHLTLAQTLLAESYILFGIAFLGIAFVGIAFRGAVARRARGYP